MRYVFAVLAIYLVVLAAVDAITLDGRYRKVVWQEASSQVQRLNMEFRHLLERIGI